jgi:plasmid stabilization system protein ParE
MSDEVSLSISPRAEADIEEISEYTTERWGEDQALRYAAEIFEELSRLTRFPLSAGRLTAPHCPRARLLPEVTY